ncbi:MAG: TIGR00374 family protein [Bacteroidetes bacterium 4572_77]|nr:MAG: TIGR00374 family protein [Bacteroidetes bacterium 4572_77]
MKTDETKKYQKLKKSLSPSKIVWPILLGFGVAAWLLFGDINADSFSFFEWSLSAVFWIFISLLMMVLRDVAYMWRLRILTHKKLKWYDSFQVIMLWEFSSAVSPSVVGGTGPAIYFLYKEGLNIGRSTAVVLTAIFLDELFFIIMVPLMVLFFGFMAFPQEGSALLNNMQLYFWMAYSLILIYTILLAYALFINPYTIKKLLSYIFLLPFLRRWRGKVRKLGNQLIITSKVFKEQRIGFWLKSFFATFISWTARYWVINFIFLAFFSQAIGWYENFLIYARQLSMWILLLISPTPGGSGIAEYIFTDFLGDIIPNLEWAVPLAILWRLISYYPYLFIGAVVLPRWLRKVFETKKELHER